jgi:mannose-6-phosphate isomerase
MPFPQLIERLGVELMGRNVGADNLTGFPLLVKLIDASDRLSVQVHPSNSYAKIYEQGSLGKTEMWYILAAKPGAKLVYGLVPGVTREMFNRAVTAGRVEDCLNTIEVFPGDALYIPAGLVHAIGAGIVITEIQQSSNLTYRVFDYERIDKNGNKRPLHLEKALAVIDFTGKESRGKCAGLSVVTATGHKTYHVANRYFSVETDRICGAFSEDTEGKSFIVLFGVEGEGEIIYGSGRTRIVKGETVLLPAALGVYQIKGTLKLLRAYVPDLKADIIQPLRRAGYSEIEIMKQVVDLA